jgi:hypothetical protein
LSDEDHYTARSLHHPGGHSRAFVFSSALYRPFAACMTPVMIGALLAMLQGQAALAFLYVGFPLALAASAVWTTIQVRREPVEIHIRDEAVAVRSLMAAATPVESISWFRLLDVRSRGDDLEILVGYDAYILRRKHWSQFDVLSQKLNRALDRAGRELRR